MMDLAGPGHGVLWRPVRASIQHFTNGAHQQVGALFLQAIVQFTGRFVRTDGAFLTSDDVPGIDGGGNEEGGDAGPLLAIDHRPIDRCRTTVVRQQGGVQVHGAQRGHVPDHLGKHPEGDHHEQVGPEPGQFRKESRVAQPLGLEHGEPELERTLLHVRQPELAPTPCRPVRCGDHRGDRDACRMQCVQRGHREPRCAHEDDALFHHRERSASGRPTQKR